MLEHLISRAAPKPLGKYSHAVIYKDLVFVCGMGPRNFETDAVPGLVLDEKGLRLDYDIEAETRATLLNLEIVLKEAGVGLKDVVEMNVFLTNMEDFPKMNAVYAEFFGEKAPVRTTLGVASLPGNIAVEMKATAVRPL
ncbi:MAG: RidA family protein [Bdellovibrionaceae bacterium]|nr:RidA family protein [Bdellovibrionales bacterium]MCB9254762.1 RidA family protein [Pseudobdellovibrionaceae bacterium]